MEVRANHAIIFGFQHKKAKLAQLCHLCGTVVRYYLFDTLDAWTNVSML